MQDTARRIVIKLYIGVTDNNWFDYLAQIQPPPDEINFWQPGGRTRFRVLDPAEPFLFKRRNEYNSQLFDLVVRAEKWLRSNDYPNQVLSWETDVWGQIPADFGRK